MAPSGAPRRGPIPHLVDAPSSETGPDGPARLDRRSDTGRWWPRLAAGAGGVGLAVVLHGLGLGPVQTFGVPAVGAMVGGCVLHRRPGPARRPAGWTDPWPLLAPRGARLALPR